MSFLGTVRKMDEHSILFSFQHFIASVFVGLAGVAVWLLKKMGTEHIETVKDISRKLEQINEKLASLGDRVTRIEVVQERHEHEDSVRRTDKSL